MISMGTMYIEVDLRRECVGLAVKVRIHAHGGENLLRDGVCHTGNSSCLAEEVAPSYDPRPERRVLCRHDVFCNEVHSTGSRIRRNQFRNWTHKYKPIRGKVRTDLTWICIGPSKTQKPKPILLLLDLQD